MQRIKIPTGLGQGIGQARELQINVQNLVKYDIPGKSDGFFFFSFQAILINFGLLEIWNKSNLNFEVFIKYPCLLRS